MAAGSIRQLTMQISGRQTATPLICGVARMLRSSRKQIETVGKGKRLKQLRKMSQQSFSDKASEVFTRNFQNEIRDSELWDQIVAEFGEKRALEILSECKAEVNTNMG